jgi:hypothetical protein
MNPPFLLTRRKVLQRAGLVITAAAFPAEATMAAAIEPVVAGQTPAPAGDHSISEVMRRLTDYMSQARDRAMPEAALEQTKWHVLDTFAAMVSGSELPPGRAAIDFARAYGGEKVATVAGDTIVCGPLEAALANGVLAHADETDDSWPGGWHPGCAVCRPRWRAESVSGSTGCISCARWRLATTLGHAR